MLSQCAMDSPIFSVIHNTLVLGLEEAPFMVYCVKRLQRSHFPPRDFHDFFTVVKSANGASASCWRRLNSLVWEDDQLWEQKMKLWEDGSGA